MRATVLMIVAAVCSAAIFDGCARDAADAPDSVQQPRQVTTDQLRTRPDGLAYVQQETVPYSGRLIGLDPAGGEKNLEMYYVEGLADGVQTRWHANGNKKSEITWRAGQKTGPYRLWHANGQLQEEGTFKNHQKHGHASAWDDTGRMVADGTYDEGWFSGTSSKWQPDHGEPTDTVFLDGVEVARRVSAANRFLGAQACSECHEEKFESFRHTSHHITSRHANEDSILGRFAAGQNEMTTGNPHLRFLMLALTDGYYQVAELEEDGRKHRQSARLDIAVGSGKIGQTYLYWRGSHLFELPVSYFTEVDAWMNSPGYRDGEVFFTRPIIGRCLECHATYFESWPHDNHSFRPDQYVLGISCEKCHGPGGDHVDYHRMHPDERQAHYIVEPGMLERDRLIEVCAQCHSGHGRPLQPSFSFRPGQPLGNYIEMESFDELNLMGVHSNNQLARLSKSQCFSQSPTMTCVSCHNPHQFERGDLQLFSQRCMKCHQPQQCGMQPQLGEKITANCIDCHMPKRRDKGTPFATAAGSEFPLMREHFVAVYPEDTQRVLSQWESAASLPTRADTEADAIGGPLHGAPFYGLPVFLR